MNKFIFSLTILLIIPLTLCSCATTITKGKWVDGKKVPDEYIEIKGIGGGKFPDGTEGEGRPMVELPDLPSTIIGR